MTVDRWMIEVTLRQAGLSFFSTSYRSEELAGDLPLVDKVVLDRMKQPAAGIPPPDK